MSVCLSPRTEEKQQGTKLAGREDSAPASPCKPCHGCGISFCKQWEAFESFQQEVTRGERWESVENGLDGAQVNGGKSSIGHGRPVSEQGVSAIGTCAWIHDWLMEDGARGVKDNSEVTSCMQAPCTETANIAVTRLGGFISAKLHVGYSWDIQTEMSCGRREGCSEQKQI